MNQKALVLLSGGIDSSLCTAMAINELGNDNVMTLSIYYGQRHETELVAAAEVSAALDAKQHFEMRIGSGLFAGSASTLFGGTLPEEEYTCEDEPASTYVPFRNGIFVSIATAFSLTREVACLWLGAHSEDALNWAYPDTTPEFIGGMANAIYIGTGRRVRLITPLQWMTKREIVAKALELDVPLKLTYSCYAGGARHCGRCATCRSRIKAFMDNGVMDPVEYDENIDWKGLEDRIKLI